MNISRRVCLTAVLVLAGSSLALAEEPSRYLTLGVGLEFATGDYGTGETVDSYSVPFSVIAYPTDRLEFELTIPFVFQSSSSTVLLGGTRYPLGRNSTLTGTGGRRRTVNESAVDITESQSGLGDMDLTAGLILIAEGDYRPLVRPLAYVKFPTGDEDKGLGTGEFDFGGGLGLAKWIGKWSTYVEGMVVFPGESDLFETQDYWQWLVSVSYALTDRMRPGIVLSGATAAFEEAPDSAEAKLKLGYWLSDQSSLGAYVLTGLSDGSPDFGGGISVFVDF